MVAPCVQTRTVHFDIREDHKTFSDESHFESGQVFTSESDAVEAGFEMGKRKIDSGFEPTNVVLNGGEDE